jgi:hypothetical protein
VDTISVSGVDLVLLDETLTPPLRLPINALDAEVTGYSNAVPARRPMRFAVFLGAGEVPLTRRVRASSLLAGLATGAVARVTGARDEATLENLRAFQEVALNGQLSPGAAPRGWARIDVAGLELLAFAGGAQRAGVTVSDGILDGSVSARFRGTDGLLLDSSLTFTDLSLSESADGPIGRYLRLPAPLDTVVFLLRNERDEVRLDVELDLHPRGGAGGQDGSGLGVSTVQLSEEIASTLGALVSRAVASSPLRVTGTLTDAIGMTGRAADEAPEVPLVLAFAAGDASPPSLQALGAQLAALVQRLHDEDDLALVLEHVLGEGDIARAALLANPPPEESLEIAVRLRRERAELVRRRDEDSAELRSFLAVGRTEEAAALLQSLRDLDHELGVAEEGLDSMLELLRPGAERGADRRTRAVSLALGRQRLQASAAQVIAALQAAGVDDAAARVEVRAVRWQRAEAAGSGGAIVGAGLEGAPAAAGTAADGGAGGTVLLTPKVRRGEQGLFSTLVDWMWPF